MKTLSVYLPREDYSESLAILETHFQFSRASYTAEALTYWHETTEDIFSLEVFLSQQTIHFCFTATDYTVNILKGAFNTMIPGALIVEVDDITQFDCDNNYVASTEIGLVRPYIFPLETFRERQADPLVPMLNLLAALPNGVEAVCQFVCRPRPDAVLLHSNLLVRRWLNRLVHLFRVKYWFKKGMSTNIYKKIYEKAHIKIFAVNFRIAVSIPNELLHGADGKSFAKQYLDSIFSGYAFINNPDMNSLKMGPIRYGEKALKKLKDRDLSRPFLLCREELATLWHIPYLDAPYSDSVPAVAQALSSRSGPPAELPNDVEDSNISFFGTTNYRGQYIPFGIRRGDRDRHMYLIGTSGAGKTKLLEMLIRSDILQGHGCGVLDPDGSLVDEVVKYIPEHRIEDVVILDPSDFEFPASLNPLEKVDESLRMRVVVGLIEIFRMRFKSEWNDRMEHLLRCAALALLSTPGTTLFSIRKMLLDEGYRTMVVQNIRDKVVREFWLSEFPKLQEQHFDAVISPILSKISEFATSRELRNILGQPFNKFDFRQLMDSRKIVLMKVSKSLIGDDNAALLGAMIITRIYQAAISRADIPAEQRNDFYLYVDQFHEFATPSFSEILSESRKYKLNITMSNQFLGQLVPEVRRAIFGNVANLIAFRVTSEDAGSLANEFMPDFSAGDLENLPPRNFIVNMAIDGVMQFCVFWWDIRCGSTRQEF